LFNAMAGIKIVRIPYKGGGPALNALMGGEVQLMFATAGAASPHIKSGRLRGLAVTTPQPSALGPGLPTVTATLPGFVSQSIYGIFAPVRTPDAIIKRVNREAVQFLNIPATKELLLSNGVEAIGSTPEELADTVKSEMARLAKLIKDAGVQTEK
jgi:tripartite-type tricarboxylate transporter receptor subunit TctC